MSIDYQARIRFVWCEPTNHRRISIRIAILTNAKTTRWRLRLHQSPPIRRKGRRQQSASERRQRRNRWEPPRNFVSWEYVILLVDRRILQSLQGGWLRRAIVVQIEVSVSSMQVGDDFAVSGLVDSHHAWSNLSLNESRRIIPRQTRLSLRDRRRLLFSNREEIYIFSSD